MTSFIDISAPIDDRLPIWPGSPGASFNQLMQIANGDDANVSEMRIELHTGTHIDAGLHFCEGGPDVEAVGLEPLVGPAFVADTAEHTAIGPAVLNGLGVPAGTSRLLLLTSNSSRGLLQAGKFTRDAAALTADGAQWVVDRGIRLIGIDYLSIQDPDDGPETHQILLRAGVVILEGVDLRATPPGPYDLVCLPIRLVGPEAAPARAILLPTNTL